MSEYPSFTEKEIEELNDLYYNHGMDSMQSIIMRFLKDNLGYSDTHKTIVDLRKYLNIKHRERSDKFEQDYKDSTLQNTLIKRIDYKNK